MSAKQDFTIYLGKTFSQILRWESTPVLYKAISGISQTAPCAVTAVAHGLPDGWRVAVVSVKGMTQLNATSEPPKDKDYYQAVVVDSDTIHLSGVNASEYKAYVSGGYLRFNTPVDLSGFTARMSIKDKVGGTEILSLTTENGRIILDNSAKTITLQVASSDTGAVLAKKGVYDLELESSTGVVTGLIHGSVVFVPEVTD
jgi:hypothetical protein